MTQFAHPRFFHAFKRLCAIVTIFAGPIFCSPSFADSWMAPTSTTIFSEDRTRQVVFTPGDGGGELVVSSITANSTNKLWSARTPNLPVGIYLSNSGSNVVTTDSWHRVGYGDYVVAIYSAKGLLAHYPLESFALPSKPPIRNRQEPISYWDDFSHSTSSRWWDEEAFKFFFPRESPTNLCIWLPWRQSWVTFDLKSGTTTGASEAALEDVNARAVAQARTDLRPLANASADSHGSRIHRALKFLAWLRRPEDLPLIQAALRSSTFDVGVGLRSSYIREKRTEITIPALTISSKIRTTADFQLAKWNRIPPIDIEQARSIHLGGVAGTLHFARTVGLKGSSLHIYLIPSTNKTADVNLGEIEHSFTYHFENLWNIGTTLPFRIESAAPGDYRMLVLHDYASPFGKDRAQFKPSPGDYTSSEIPITITPGKTTSDLHIDCKTKVEPGAAKK